jgi:hypothetical protein
MTPEVWAPWARSVALVTEVGARPMEPVGDGWYRAGCSYATETATGTAWTAGALADPRSHRQPDGVDGPSAVVDHDRFVWTDAHWRGFHLPGSVLYELHVGTFTAEGTFDAAIAHLDDLAALGVGAVEVMPVAAFPGRCGWGYDGVFWYAPHEAYGGPEAMKRFVDAAHTRGIGVVLDVVYNHFGPEGNVTGAFGPYVHGAHTTPWGPAVNLDGRWAGTVRRFIVENALHWLRHYHLDGLRLDAVHALVDDSAVHLLEELRSEVAALGSALGRRLTLIAENDTNDPGSSPRTRQGGPAWTRSGPTTSTTPSTPSSPASPRATTSRSDGRPTSPRRSTACTCTTGRGSSPRAGAAAARWARSTGTASWCVHRTMTRSATAPGETGWSTSPARGSDGGGSHRAARASDADAVHGRGVGGEHTVPVLLRHVRRSARRSDHETGVGRSSQRSGGDRGDPDPNDPTTMAACVLRGRNGPRARHTAMSAWYATLMGLRAAHPDLRDGRPDRTAAAADDRAGWLVVSRGSFGMAVNLSGTDQLVPGAAASWDPDLGAPRRSGQRAVLAASSPERAAWDGSHVHLAPMSVAVIGPVA